MTRPVEIHGLMVQRGSFTLDVPSLTVESGSVVGLVGRNASGKTTLLQVLSGQLVPASGTARVFGFDPLIDSGMSIVAPLATDTFPHQAHPFVGS